MAGFGARLKEALDDLRLTQAEACERTGESSANMSRWLAGEFTPKVAQAITVADKLGLSVGWLVAGQGPKWVAHLEENPDLAAFRATILREAAAALDHLAAGDLTAQVKAVEDAAEKAVTGGRQKQAAAGGKKRREG